jgi:hypothetical protein
LYHFPFLAASTECSAGSNDHFVVGGGGGGGPSGGNDRFCARLKTDISAFSSGLQGHLRSCLTILDSSRRPLSKNVRHDLVRPRRPELEAEMSVFNLAQKRPDCKRACDYYPEYFDNVFSTLYLDTPNGQNVTLL